MTLNYVATTMLCFRRRASSEQTSPKLRLLTVAIVIVNILLISKVAHGGTGKVLDINERLPEFVEKHPDKNWLVKFYAPWCYHCQQMEPTYNNVAEKIYNHHGNLVVGRVDCTKYGRVCETYGVDSYPTLIHINKDTAVKYRGDRSESSIISFAERLQGPDVNFVKDCDSLKEATFKHGIVVLSTYANPENQLRKLFEALARAHKSNYWFYQYIGTCKDFIHEEGLYLLKRNLNRPLRFPEPKEEVPADSLEKSLVDWLNKESISIYGQVSYRNIEKILNTGKLLVIAVLDEYKPARRFAATSEEFHKRFGKLAHKYAQYDDQLLFAYSSDLELIEYFTITPVTAPNVILVKPDFSYHLMLDGKNSTRSGDDISEEISAKLRDHNIRSLITAAKNDKLSFSGGNGYLHVILRHILGNFNKFMTMYRANPLLVSLIFGFPSLIVIFVIYTTCFYSGSEGPDEHEYSDDEEEEELDTYDEERAQLISDDHLKQD